MCPYVGNATTRKTFTLRSENDDSSRNQDVFFLINGNTIYQNDLN